MGKHTRTDPLAARRLGLGILAWLLFAAAWGYVGSRPGAVLLSWQLLVLPGSLVAVGALNAVWVRHNRRIYQSKGPRRGLPVVESIPTHDRLGRPLSLDVAAARTAGEVVLEVIDGCKTYVPVTA